MTPQEHANAVWRAGASPESLAGAITAYTEEIRGELHRARADHAAEVERLDITIATLTKHYTSARASSYAHQCNSLARAVEIQTLTAENAALKEEVAVLKSQVENADLYLEQTRMNARAQWQTKVADAEKRIAVVEAQANTALDDLTAARARIAELEGSINEAIGCFVAAEVEGLLQALQDKDGERLFGLYERRIGFAYHALIADPNAAAAIDSALSTQAPSK